MLVACCSACEQNAIPSLHDELTVHNVRAVVQPDYDSNIVG